MNIQKTRRICILWCLFFACILFCKVDGKATDKTGVLLTNVSASQQDSHDRYLIRMKVEGTTVTDRFWNNNTVYLDGAAISTEGVHYAPIPNTTDMVYFLIYYNWVESDATRAGDIGEHTVEIRPGTAFGTDCVIKNHLIYKIAGNTIEPVDTEGIATLRGDINVDNDVNLKDMLRMKKYFDKVEETFYFDHFGANVNADEYGYIDDKDLLKLLEYLLEGDVIEGIYMRGDYPMYMDDVELSSTAYSGVRGKGKAKYTYNFQEDDVLYTIEMGSKKVVTGYLSSEIVDQDFINEYEFRQYKDVGMTHIMSGSDCSWAKHDYFGLGGGMYQNMKYYMLIAEDVGVDVYVTSYGINLFLEDMEHKDYAIGTKADGTKFNYTKEMLIEDMKAMVEFMEGKNAMSYWGMQDSSAYPEYRERLNANVKLNSFVGIQLSDEIDIINSEKFKFVVEEMRKLKPDCLFKTANLLHGCRHYPAEHETEMVNVMQEFGVPIGRFNYDTYPFRRTLEQTGTWLKYEYRRGDRYILDTWFNNLAECATNAKELGVETGIVIQSFGMDNVAGQVVLSLPTTREEMSWQIYTSLAYGMNEIDYFTYWDHRHQTETGERHTGSMVSYPESGDKSVKNSLYYLVQEVNQEIRAYDHVFMDFSWQSAQRLGTTDDFIFDTSESALGYGISDAASFTATGEGVVLIGNMKDEEKSAIPKLDGTYEDVWGFWLVNASDPTTKADYTMNVTGIYHNATHLMVYHSKGQELLALDEDGQYEITLGEGDGVFVIPMNFE